MANWTTLVGDTLELAHNFSPDVIDRFSSQSIKIVNLALAAAFFFNAVIDRIYLSSLFALRVLFGSTLSKASSKFI
jgi:hypothetical protein